MMRLGRVIGGLGGLAGALVLLALTGCGGGEPAPSAAAGEGLFNANCAACHGEKAVGHRLGRRWRIRFTSRGTIPTSPFGTRSVTG